MAKYKLVFPYLFSGILLGLGFLQPELWLIGIFGAGYFLYTLSVERRTKIIIGGSLLAWFVKFLFVLGFYWTMYPITWLPFDFGYGELALIGLYWITVAFFLGTSGLVFAVLYVFLRSISLVEKSAVFVSVPLIWVTAEIMGSVLLSVFTLGPGSDVNTYFSLGYLGLLLAEHMSLLQFASLAGVYSLSVIAVLIALVFAALLEYRPARWRIVFVVATILLLGTANLTFTFSGSNNVTTVDVAVVSTHYPVQESFNRDSISNLETMQQASLSAALETQASYIIFPEDARIFDQKDDIEKEKAKFNFLNQEASSIIIDSGRVEYPAGSVLQGLIFDTATNEHAAVHKRYLVPQGEFVPYIYEWFFRLFGFNELMDSVTEVVGYQIGPYTDQSELPESYPGVLFCFESASATGVKSLLNERPDLPFVAHPVSHSWFHTPESFWSQLDAALRVQAVWNNVAIVSAGNHAPSQLFLPSGSVIQPESVASGEYWNVGIVEVPVEYIYD